MHVSCFNTKLMSHFEKIFIAFIGFDPMPFEYSCCQLIHQTNYLIQDKALKLNYLFYIVGAF